MAVALCQACIPLALLVSSLPGSSVDKKTSMVPSGLVLLEPPNLIQSSTLALQHMSRREYDGAHLPTSYAANPAELVLSSSAR